MAYLWDRLDSRGMYFFGVGIGLVIAWVSGVLAYLKDGSSTDVAVILLELVASIILIAVSFLANTKKIRSKEN